MRRRGLPTCGIWPGAKNGARRSQLGSVLALVHGLSDAILEGRSFGRGRVAATKAHKAK
jgi:hypothetical protein